MKKLCLSVRILTTPPLMAMALCFWLYCSTKNIFCSFSWLMMSLITLGFFPLSAYILQPILPRVKHLGREGQRNLAMLFCFLGYLAGLVCSLAFGGSTGMVYVFLTYLLSGLLMVLFNKALHIRASGHACGVFGPIAMIVLLGGPKGLILLPFYLLSGICSVKMRRHTVGEWLLGSALSPAAMLIAWLILGTPVL